MPLECSSSSSAIASASELSTASNSPLQMTMCRSFGGKSAASSDTSVVNEEPSEVLVKLKKLTDDRSAAARTCGSVHLSSNSASAH
jgi:hypothetical protein